MAYSAQPSKLPTLEETIEDLRGKWINQDRGKISVTAYELRGDYVENFRVSVPHLFDQILGWRDFIRKPSFSRKCERDDNGYNKNQWWNDLEIWIARYNLASALQWLLWSLGADPHSMMPGHRRLGDRQSAQPPPFPESVLRKEGVA